MHWILQNNIFKEQAFENLLAVLRRFDIPHSEHKVVPFIGNLLPVGEVIDDVENYENPMFKELAGPVICMGSYSMRHSAKKYDWTPGVYDLMEVGDFDNCFKHWGNLMLNADSVVMSFRDAQWSGGERFIRPTNDSKYFAGKLIDAGEFKEWQTNVCVLGLDYGNSLTPETLIQIAKPKEIYTEYRCWVVSRELITMSLYKRGNRVVYENMDGLLGDRARNFAWSIIKDVWVPHDAFCLDVCETSEGWKIVEVNTINSSGFYAADLQKLVMALEEANP
jgi:hypothetical protein